MLTLLVGLAKCGFFVGNACKVNPNFINGLLVSVFAKRGTPLVDLLQCVINNVSATSFCSSHSFLSRTGRTRKPNQCIERYAEAAPLMLLFAVRRGAVFTW